jgi:hypothetical protein
MPPRRSGGWQRRRSGDEPRGTEPDERKGPRTTVGFFTKRMVVVTWTPQVHARCQRRNLESQLSHRRHALAAESFTERHRVLRLEEGNPTKRGHPGARSRSTAPPIKRNPAQEPAVVQAQYRLGRPGDMVRPLTLKVGPGDFALAAGHGLPTLRLVAVRRRTDGTPRSRSGTAGRDTATIARPTMLRSLEIGQSERPAGPASGRISLERQPDPEHLHRIKRKLRVKAALDVVGPTKTVLLACE